VEVGTLVLYSGGPAFEYWPGDRLLYVIHDFTPFLYPTESTLNDRFVSSPGGLG
jgi:hypothetical protein